MQYVMSIRMKVLCIFSVSYGTVYTSVREDNPRDLASGLSPITTDAQIMQYIMSNRM